MGSAMGSVGNGVRPYLLPPSPCSVIKAVLGADLDEFFLAFGVAGKGSNGVRPCLLPPFTVHSHRASRGKRQDASLAATFGGVRGARCVKAVRNAVATCHQYSVTVLVGCELSCC